MQPKRPAFAPGAFFFQAGDFEMGKTWIRAAAVAAVVAGFAGAALAIASAHYFDSRGLDPRPYPLKGIELPPPPAKAGVEYYGKLRLDVYIDADGTVNHVEIGESTVPPETREAAIRAFSQARWEPGRKWGIRVKSVKRVEVDLTPPPNLQAPPTRQGP